MILIPTTTIIAEMNRIAEYSIRGKPVVPQGLAAENVWVPKLRFLETDFLRFWDDYREYQGISGLAQDLRKAIGMDPGLCDLYADAACLEMKWMAAKASVRHRKAGTSAFFGANVVIQAEPLNGISGDGNTGHKTVIAAFTRDESNVELVFWEPQQQPGKAFTYESIESAINRGVDLLDVFA